MSNLDPDLFVTEQIHERPIELPNGRTATLYFRELTTAELRRYRMDEQSEDETVQLNAMARLICLSLVDPDGKTALTYDEATHLKPRVTDKIIAAIMELNDFQKREAEAKKPSPPEVQNGSGTS